MTNFFGKKINSKNGGFVALIIVILVSGILLVLVASSAIDSGLFFDQALRKEYRAMNYYYAYDCLDQAALFLAHDYFFSVSAAMPVDVPEFKCKILSVVAQGNLRILNSVGYFMNADVYRTATIRLDDNSLEIVSIQ